MIGSNKGQQAVKVLFTLALILFSSQVLAGVGPVIPSLGKTTGFGAVANQVTHNYRPIAKLITASSYVAGLAFSIAAIFKFKQHKDNSTQVPVGTPIALVFIAASLLFFPTVMSVTGHTMFQNPQVAGPYGMAQDINKIKSM